MKYLSKFNITVFATFSILLLILTSFVLCNPSDAQYKARITVDTVNLEINPYQPVNTIDDVYPEGEIQENSSLESENIEENNYLD